MPPERHAPDHPQEWLKRARSNLAMARADIPEVCREDLCFEAQQASEKAIKSVLIKRRLEFPYVHDLGRLLTLLEQAGEPIPYSVREAERLTQYAVDARYPGLADPVTEAQYREALALAEKVVLWAEGLV